MNSSVEVDVFHARPAELRYHQASYFFEKFKESCGTEANKQHSTFHWISYSDAFLMALISLQDFVSEKKKAKLLKGSHRTYIKKGTKPPKGYKPNVFLVLKLMRNQTIHRYVFASPSQKSKAKPSVTRIINVHVGVANPGAWVQPRITTKTMRRVCRRVMTRFKKTNKNDPTSDVVETRLYLKIRKRDGQDDIRIHEIFEEGLRFVEKVCGFKRLNSLKPTEPA